MWGWDDCDGGQFSSPNSPSHVRVWLLLVHNDFFNPWISSSGLVWLNNLVKLCFSSPKITHLFRQFRPPTEDFLSNAPTQPPHSRGMRIFSHPQISKRGGSERQFGSGRGGAKVLNRDEGVYCLSHVYDKLLQQQRTVHSVEDEDEDERRSSSRWIEACRQYEKHWMNKHRDNEINMSSLEPVH